MDSARVYISSIPANAQEKVTARYGEDGKKRAEYYVGKELVGIREFYQDAQLEGEWPFRNGVRHGRYYGWYPNGGLHSCEPYENGVPHGTAYQWARDGTLMGSYTMDHGTGIDLWWEDWDDGSINLAEVYYKQAGNRHGFEWWLNPDSTLFVERHWHQDELQGIEREWNSHGGLRRGFPRYFIHGERVTKRQYLKACTIDPTLPPFRIQDNAPQRIYPSEIALHLRPGS